MSWIDELEEGARDAMLRCRANSMPEVDALLSAGWRFELPEIVNRKEGEPPHMDTEPWQWYWRSPPKRKNSKGRKYWSTTMAYNALRRQLSSPAVSGPARIKS